MKKTAKQRPLAKLSSITLFAVYLLIFVGGVVRSTGSGMGCPDWPQCFGTWIPPTQEAQLPENYQTLFYQKRMQKNARLAHILECLGASALAEKLQEKPIIQEETTFNPFKTWTEYINRVIGVTVGLLIGCTFLAALSYKGSPAIGFVAGALLILTLFEAWIGSLVVATHLLPWLVTFHMLIALIIIGLLVLSLIHI